MLDLKAKKILVTGGTGFIGRVLVSKLLDSGAFVRVLDNDSRGSKKTLENLNGNLEIRIGDIRDINMVRESANSMDMICHLAYVNGTKYFYEKPNEIIEIAIKGMMNCIEACIEEQVGQFILASSSEVYQNPKTLPTDETVPLIIPDIYNPRYAYGGGKIACELMLISYSHKYFDRSLIIRPHNVYGPQMGWEHVIPQFICRMKKQSGENLNLSELNFKIQGSGKETRSFIYIDDFIKALFLILKHGKNREIYNIGTEEEIMIQDLAYIIGKKLGLNINIIPSILKKGGTPRRCPDIKKIQSLGFSNNITLDIGLEKTSNWYIDNLSQAPAHAFE